MMVIKHNKIMIRFRMERKTIFPQDQTPNFNPGKGVVVVVVMVVVVVVVMVVVVVVVVLPEIVNNRIQD